MKLLTRSLAACTVFGAIVTVPLLSRLTPVATPAVFERGATEGPGSFAPDWSMKVVAELAQRRLPIDDPQMQAIVCHAEAVGARFGLDPFTVLAMIEVESGFDPFAVSRVEARGLMQLREDTAREVAERIGVTWTGSEQLFDPETNLLLGAAYFRELLDRFGDVNLALAAFHAGPARFSVGQTQLGPVSVEYTNRVWSAIERLYDASLRSPA